jgi:hypothetical protein
VASAAPDPIFYASESPTPYGPTGQITGYGGLCLDDRNGYVAEYNPVQVYTCNGTAAQRWTLVQEIADSTLRVNRCFRSGDARTWSR